MVNDSPSISISRLIVLSSLVAIGCRQSDTLAKPGGSVESGYAVGLGWSGGGGGRGASGKPGGRSNRLSTGEHVVDEPLPVLLTNDRFADHSGLLQHVMRGLKHTLQM